jgi:heme-degrading monooxygenase HmoA
MLAILFRSKLTGEAGADYDAMNADLESPVKENSGFVGATSYVAEDGERLTVVWWRDEKSLEVWRNLPRHQEAQSTGRKLWYSYYKMDVATITRTRNFEREHPGTGTARQEECVDDPLLPLTDELRSFPHYLRSVAQGMPDTQLRLRPTHGGFSMVEHACHLRDYDAMGFLGRMQRILAERDPFLREFEGQKLALEHNYQTQSFLAAADDFDRNRQKTLEALKALSCGQMEGTATIGTMGTVSIRRLVEIVAEHFRTHRGEIEDLLGEIQARV